MDFSLIVVIHLQAGIASDTFNQMLAQAPTSIVWNPDALVSVPTPAVDGVYSTYAAWCALLKGTGLTLLRVGQIYEIYPEKHPGEYDAVCRKPNGWGPDFIHPPVADWR